ncbi:hypothetical protein CDL15_Pgr012886 [Punica granatum]|uniref:PRP1 splicing factor N-terminal domain-containing protein n=1 Tax=Punica granatum TaxID=22663 RepID=A0A218XDW4_PUNGR|nr:hypothetical protein CDL15_Pgr012886 [Punica granatum]
MPPKRKDRVEDVHDRENLRHLEQRLDHMDQMDQRMERMLGQLTQQMAALMENQNRRNLNPNFDPDREEIEYDSNSEGNATLFSEEDPSDETFFMAGGDGEPDFDEDDEGDDKGYDENWKFDEFEGNDVGLFAYAEYDEDDKEADAVWEAIDKRMDSRRKDRREARLEEEIEKYHAPNQQMRTMMSDVSIEPITATKYFELGFFPIIRSEAWADIGFRSRLNQQVLAVWVLEMTTGSVELPDGDSRLDPISS